MPILRFQGDFLPADLDPGPHGPSRTQKEGPKKTILETTHANDFGNLLEDHHAVETAWHVKSRVKEKTLALARKCKWITLCLDFWSMDDPRRENFVRNLCFSTQIRVTPWGCIGA